MAMIPEKLVELISGMGNRRTRSKHTTVPHCAPQIPDDLTRARTLAALVENRRLTAGALPDAVHATTTPTATPTFSVLELPNLTLALNCERRD
jgi:hypothetical protein